jgi:hypothetical protein
VVVLDVAGELIPYAVGVSLSPLPLVTVLLLLLGQGGLPAGSAFLAGRVVTVAALATAFSFLAESVPESSGPAMWSTVLRIALGLVLVVVAVVKIARRRAVDDEAGLPRWMVSIESMRPWAAVRLGVVLSVVNVKELAFGLGVGLVVGVGRLAAGPTVLVVVGYAVLASLTVAAPVLVLWRAGDRARPPLTSARAWLVRNSSVVLAAVLLVIGAILVGNGVTAL